MKPRSDNAMVQWLNSLLTGGRLIRMCWIEIFRATRQQPFTEQNTSAPWRPSITHPPHACLHKNKMSMQHTFMQMLHWKTHVPLSHATGIGSKFVQQSSTSTVNCQQKRYERDYYSNYKPIPPMHERSQ